MKQALFIILALFCLSNGFAQSHFNNPIGKLTSNSATILANTDSIEFYWKQLMATQGFIVEINSLWIDTLMEQGDAFWYIFCSTEPDTLKAFVPLVLSNDTLYEEATLLLDGTEVTCTGCADGCSPRRKGNGDGYCTNCNTPSVECTKSETLKSGGIFNWAY